MPSNGLVIFVLHTDFLVFVFVFCHKRSNRPDVNHQAIRFQVATHAESRWSFFLGFLADGYTFSSGLLRTYKRKKKSFFDLCILNEVDIVQPGQKRKLYISASSTFAMTIVAK